MIERLLAKYDTSDPEELASNLGIHIHLWNMTPEINGIYQYIRRNKFIFINNNLPDHKKKYVIAHELAHAILHTKYNAKFIRDVNWANLNKIEREAHQFATYLLLWEVDTTDYSTQKNMLLDQGIPLEMEKFI